MMSKREWLNYSGSVKWVSVLVLFTVTSWETSAQVTGCRHTVKTQKQSQKPEVHFAPSFIPRSLKEVILYLYIIKAHSDL